VEGSKGGAIGDRVEGTWKRREEGRGGGRRDSNEPIRTAMGKMSAMMKGSSRKRASCRSDVPGSSIRWLIDEEREEEGWLKDDGGSKAGRK